MPCCSGSCDFSRMVCVSGNGGQVSCHGLGFLWVMYVVIVHTLYYVMVKELDIVMLED